MTAPGKPVRARGKAGPSFRKPLPLQERSHLDGPDERRGVPGRYVQGLFEVGALEDVVPADLFFCLGERAVGYEHLAVADPHAFGCGVGFQPATVQVHAAADRVLEPGVEQSFVPGRLIRP